MATPSRVIVLAAVVASTVHVAAAAAAERGALTVGRLRWDARDRPLGYIQFEPRMGWVVSTSKRGQRQTAYQVLVASDPAKLAPGRADVWDSKKVVSAESINVHYDGPTPRARQRAYWTVRVWDTDDRPSAFAPPSWWEVGLLDEEWEGQWIGRPMSGGAGAGSAAAGGGGAGADPYDRSVTHVRKTFTVGKTVKRARLYASAFGVYEFTINGKRAGDQVLAPGYTDYEKRVLFQAYDVTSLIRRGENAVGAVVAGGWCTAALGGRAGACGVEPSRVMAQLELLLADGTLQTIITDRSWKAHAGPITAAHLVDGESYDARLEMPGWDAPGFDDGGWSPVAQYDKKKERDLVADPGPPMRVAQDLRPVQVTEPRKGVYVFDLGQLLAGRARLRVGGMAAGATVTLRYGEALAADGTVALAGGRASADSYTARAGGGAASETWEARFAVRAFRYVEVQGLRARPGLDALTGRAVQSVAAATGRLETSDPRVDRLFREIDAAQRAAFVSVPAAGLGRERGGEPPGVLLDGGAFAGTACLDADVQTFFRKWIDDIRDAQLPDASYAATAPSVEPAASRRAAGPGAAVAGVRVPWALYRCYADRTALDAHLPSMGRWLHHLRALYPGLVWGAAPDPSLIGTAEMAWAADALARMMRHAGPGLDGEARGFEQLAGDVRAAFARAFVRPDGSLKDDTQAAYATALALGALPPGARAAAGKRLVAAIERSGGHATTGLAGAAYLLPALSLVGRDDLAYRLLLEAAPSSHYALGAVGEWMYDAIGGIALDPAAPAGRHVLVRPRPGGGLTRASARYDSLYGPIATSWRLEGGRFRLEVTVPANATATVTLPFSGQTAEIGSGTHEFVAMVPSSALAASIK